MSNKCEEETLDYANEQQRIDEKNNLKLKNGGIRNINKFLMIYVQEK